MELDRNINGLEYLSRKSVKQMRDKFRADIDTELKEVISDDTPANKVKALRKYIIVQKLKGQSPSIEKLQEVLSWPERIIRNATRIEAKPLFNDSQRQSIKEAANRRYKKYGHGLLGTGNRRLYFPLEGDATKSLIEDKIEEYLGDKGYFIADYKKGYATDVEGKQQYKIGKLLKEDADLKKEFMHDPARLCEATDDNKATSNKQYLVLSDYANDIAYMSTRRGWESCMSSHKVYAGKPAYDVRGGSLIGYLVNDDDPNIFNPVARVVFKPFYNQDGDTIYHVGTLHGSYDNLFVRTANRIADKISSDKEGIYRLAEIVYADRAPSRKVRLDPKKLKDINAEDFLKMIDIEYTKNIFGNIVIEGDLDISNSNLRKLPDLSKVIIKGGFDCSHNKLTSLKGAPKEAYLFLCTQNNLTDLSGVSKMFNWIYSDLGSFHNYKDIPRNLLGVEPDKNNTIKSILQKFKF